MKACTVNTIKYLVTIICTLATVSFTRADEVPSVKVSELLELGISTQELSEAMNLENPVVAKIAPTGSMRPVLDDYDFIIIDYISFEDLQKGDMVIANYGENIVCHRIVSMGSNSHVTRGDNCLEPDRTRLNSQNYVARVALIIKNDYPKTRRNLSLIAHRLTVLAMPTR